MDIQNHSEYNGQPLMLPPPLGTFQDREDLIRHVRDFGASQGYVVTIKKSRRDRRVILGCDRGGVYRNRRKIEESKRKRKASSRLINCPFEAIGKKEDDGWVLTIKNGEHNHEALKDMSEHPYSRRFTEEEVRQIKLMTDAGIKPLQVLKALKQSNPELQSTPRHLYNLKAKIRQGNISEKSFHSWRPNRSAPVSTSVETSARLDFPLKVPNLIGGKFVESQACSIIDVVNPATQEVVSQVPLTTYEEFKAAVIAAKQAFPSWRNTPVTARQRIMFKLQELIRRDIDKLAMNIVIEQGKTLNGAKGDVLRGLEVVEHACGMATLQMGEYVPNASYGIDTFCTREPLGVCAGVCPFNFPAMIGLWMFPIAITCGNTFILKPSEINPGASMILAALAIEAGLPDGVLNIVHGTHDIVNHICDDDDIKAISFTGSNNAGIHTYARAAARGKRVQSNMGAKNHAIIMPDASADATLDALVAAGFGAAGHRCMTLSTAVFVGDSAPWEKELVDRAKVLKVNAGTEPGADLGPVISKEEKDRISRLVENSVESGARLILDGRNILVPRYERGNFVAPTILCDVTTSMECYKEEMFGPVFLCMKVDSLEEAISIVNRNKNGNGASIFTTSGATARKFQTEVEASLVGINVPVPIPLPFSSCDGSKASFAGDLNFSGKAGVQFYTQIKTVAQQWKDLPGRRVSLALPPTSVMEISSQQLSHVQAPTSESDLPSREVSPALPSAFDRDLVTRHNMSERFSSTSEGDSQTTEEESQSEGGSPTISDAMNKEVLLSRSAATENNFMDHGSSPSMTRTSVTSDFSQPSTSPKTADLSMEKTQTPSSLKMAVASSSDMAPLCQNKDNLGSISLRAADTTHQISERALLPISQKNDNIDSIPLRTNINTHPTSKGFSILTSQKNDSMGLLSLMNDNSGSISQQTDINMLPSSDRGVYMPIISHPIPNVGMASQRTDTATCPTSEMLYMLTPVVSLRTAPTVFPGSDRVYMSSSPYRNDIVPSQITSPMPPTSEKLYMPSGFQMNEGMTSTSERLCFPADSQRFYIQQPQKLRDGTPHQEVSRPSRASPRSDR